MNNNCRIMKAEKTAVINYLVIVKTKKASSTK